MRRYYIFMTVLGGVVLAIALAALASSVPRRQDASLYSALSQVMDGVVTYNTSHTDKGLPGSLSDVYSNNDLPSKHVTYTKVSDTVYMACATFKTAFDPNGSFSNNSYGYDAVSYEEAQAYADERNNAHDGTKYWVVQTYSMYDGHHTAGKNCYVGQVAPAGSGYNDVNGQYPYVDPVLEQAGI